MEIIEHYEIRTDVISNRYNTNLENFALGDANTKVSKALFGFLDSNKLISPTYELYEGFIQRIRERHPDYVKKLLDELPDTRQWQDNHLCTVACMYAMRDQILNNQSLDLTDDSSFNWRTYYFIEPKSKHSAPNQGAIINQKVEVPLKSYDYFKYFFSLILSHVSPPSNFLDYHLTRSFRDDLTAYRLFLTDCLAENLNGRKAMLKEWLKLHKTNPQNKEIKEQQNVPILSSPELIRISPSEQNRKILVDLANIFITQSSSNPEIYGLMDASYEFDLLIGGLEEKEYDDAFSLLTGRKISRLKKTQGKNYESMFDRVTEYLNNQ